MTRIVRASVVIFLGILVLSAAQPASSTVHEFADKCDLCHVKNQTTGKLALLKPSQVAAQCSQCHQRLSGTSHPVGEVPAEPLPPGFPVDEQGRVSCLTCHQAHQPKDGDPLDSLIRGGITGEDFCGRCHARPTNTAELDAHASAFGSAHDEDPDTVKIVSDIDERSLTCLSCHDDLIAGSRLFSTKGSGTSRSHPIGVPYPRGRSDYKSQSILNPRIRLFNDRVACESCHNIYSHYTCYLVMNNKGSRLCIACHNK